MMSADVILSPAADRSSTFTLFRDGNLIDVYAGAVGANDFVTSVEAVTIRPLVVVAPDGPVTISIDPAAGNPLPGGLSVAAGNVVINQDLSDAGAPVALTVNAGATVDLGTSQDLAGLSIEAGATVDVTAGAGTTVSTTSVSVAGTLDLGDSGLIARQPTAADLGAIQSELDAGTLGQSGDDSQGIVAETPETIGTIKDGGIAAEPIGGTLDGNATNTEPGNGTINGTTNGPQQSVTVSPGVAPGTGFTEKPQPVPANQTGAQPTVQGSPSAGKDGKVTVNVSFQGVKAGTYYIVLSPNDGSGNDINITVTVTGK